MSHLKNERPLSRKELVYQNIYFAHSRMNKAQWAFSEANLKFLKTDQSWSQKSIDYDNAASDLVEAEFQLEDAKRNLEIISAFFSETLEDWDTYSNETCKVAQNLFSEAKADWELSSKLMDEAQGIANKIEDELGDLEELYYSNQISLERADKNFETAKVEFEKSKECLLQIVNNESNLIWKKH